MIIDVTLTQYYTFSTFNLYQPIYYLCIVPPRMTYIIKTYEIAQAKICKRALASFAEAELSSLLKRKKFLQLRPVFRFLHFLQLFFRTHRTEIEMEQLDWHKYPLLFQK